MLRPLSNVAVAVLRRTWLVAALTVLICGSFAARAVAALDGPPPEAAPPGPSSVAGSVGAGAGAGAGSRIGAATGRGPADVAALGDSLVARNMFCSTCTPAAPGAAAAAGYQGHPIVLIATSIGAEPRATLRVIPTEIQGSWALGEDIPGVGRIDAIDPTAIEVADAAGHTKRISLLDGAAGSGPIAATTDRPAATDPAADDNNPFRKRVTKINETTYSVERSLVRDLVMGTVKGGSVRPMPVPDGNGGILGIRLIGVRGNDNAAAAIGLRNGDVIKTIDGEELRKAQQLLDLFAKLDDISSIELGGTRAGGKPLKLTLQLR